MKVVLLNDINGIGKKNDVKEVADGFARNFLIAKKLATPATQKSVETVRLLQEKENDEVKKKNAVLRQISKQIKNKKILIYAKEKDGKLFGSISAKEISQELKKEGVEIPEKSIILKETIKRTGNYKISVSLSKEIVSDFILVVNEEK
jgi:large subunit ribosomal protein L9